MKLTVFRNGRMITYHEFEDFEMFKKHVVRHLKDAEVVIIVKRNRLG